MMEKILLQDRRQALVEHLQKKFPALQSLDWTTALHSQMISPFQVSLPTDLRHQAEKIAQILWKLRCSSNYLSLMTKEFQQFQLPMAGNVSLFSSMDFHVDSQQNLQLIEINTNAAFLGLGCELYSSLGRPAACPDFQIEDLKKDILSELKKNNSPVLQPRIAIVDEKPEEQRLYIEFLYFQALFQSWGWKCDIRDIRENLSEYDFIYNRHTDFYLQNPISENMRQSFENKKWTLSPQPLDYFLLADKQRLTDWSQNHFLESFLEKSDCEYFRNHIPKCQTILPENAEEIWSQRKKLFFKPLRSFGSKQSYKGSSISRKAFMDLIQTETLAQTYCPASEIQAVTPEGPQSFKYDLRVHFYENRIQNVVARLYQGQVTNARTLHGGFACVQWI